MKVRVVDALCGAGKTTWCFDYMNKNSLLEKWIFVSPYLGEVGDGEVSGRIQKDLPSMKFVSPKTAPNKKESFKRAVENGRNIAITHKLFTGFTQEIADLIKEQNYNLVIDETIDLINFYDDIPKDDVKLLIRAGMISVGEKGILHWNNEEFSDYKGRDSDIKDLCDIGCLWLYGEDVLIQRIPPACIQACKTVTIMTYLFKGSLMHSWLKLNNIEWESYDPPSLKPAKELKDNIREKIHLVKPPKFINDLQVKRDGSPRDGAFNMTWYRKASIETMTEVKKSVESTIKYNMIKGEIFWTCFKAWKPVLEGVGYTRSKRVPWLDEPRPTFLSKNTRASNEYRDCTKCVYMVNIYPNGSLETHLAHHDIVIDRDLYALSEIVQFIFRGCIRCNEEMDLYILSNRMRSIFEEWLMTDK